MPKGDHKPNLNPHIPFIPPKRDDKSSQPAVEIMILNKDLRKKAMKDSTEKKKLPAIETFASSTQGNRKDQNHF